MRDVLVEGKWVHPEPKICPKCHQILPERGECPICKRDKEMEEWNRDHQEPEKCPVCGDEFLIHGHCRLCQYTIYK